MKTKLTLNLNDKIIFKSKDIAAERKTSISRLVSDYFEDLWKEEEAKAKLALLSKRLKPKD